MVIPRSHLLLIAVAALVLSVIGASGLNTVLASPSSAPPGGNVPEPLNKGNRSQTKEGALTINDGITTGKPGLAEALRVIGGMTVSGGITATGATTSGQFCLGGVCIAAWNDPRVGPDISNYCVKGSTDPACGRPGSGGTDGGWEQVGRGTRSMMLPPLNTGPVEISNFVGTSPSIDFPYEYRLLLITTNPWDGQNHEILLELPCIHGPDDRPTPSNPIIIRKLSCGGDVARVSPWYSIPSENKFAVALKPERYGNIRALLLRRPQPIP